MENGFSNGLELPLNGLELPLNGLELPPWRSLAASGGWGIGVLGLVVVLLGVELVLRWSVGFGRPLLYQGDARIGYLLVPNQTTRRMGKRIAINAYSMRSDAIAPTPTGSTHRILMLGDSIVNGGWWTDQDATLSACLEQRLQLGLNRPSIEVLNASANSWGPRNELAYLQRFGTFGAKQLILVINTDDLFAVAPSSVAVGRDRNYPNRLPLGGWPFGAIAEVIERSWPRRADPLLVAAQQEEGDRVARNLEAIAQIHAIAHRDGMDFLMVMTPLKRELAIAGGPRDYEVRERSRLVEFTQTQGIAFIDMLPRFDATPNPLDLYHDHIHLSAFGNASVVEAITANQKPS